MGRGVGAVVAEEPQGKPGANVPLIAPVLASTVMSRVEPSWLVQTDRPAGMTSTTPVAEEPAGDTAVGDGPVGEDVAGGPGDCAEASPPDISTETVSRRSARRIHALL
jgi:hypothetical protein